MQHPEGRGHDPHPAKSGGYWVPKVQKAAEEHGIPFKAIHITEKEMAQNVPAPVTTYALFRDGKFVTQSIQSDKKFLKLAGAAD